MPSSLYRRLRQRNPAPFAGYFDLGDFQIVSASPERFLRVCGRPGRDAADQGHAAAAATIRPPTAGGRPSCSASEKDRAENVMIVDLLRNDLSRVCRPDSVDVRAALPARDLRLRASPGLGRARRSCATDWTPIDLLRAAFPGGSITGAPKIRAMEIIAELEPTARGAYCGSLGYLGFDGAMDPNILIRTITAGRGWWQFPVGGGIVAESDPTRVRGNLAQGRRAAAGVPGRVGREFSLRTREA